MRKTLRVPRLGNSKAAAALWVPALLAVTALSSCVTGSGQGSWYSCPELPAYWEYHTGEVQIIVDHAPEQGISSQAAVMAETILVQGKKKAPPADFRAFVDIRIEQRSFLHKTELFNTVSIVCRIRDEQGRVFGSEYEYRVGKRSVVSSKEQYRFLKRALKKVLAEQRKRRWDVFWYRKRHA